MIRTHSRLGARALRVLDRQRWVRASGVIAAVMLALMASTILGPVSDAVGSNQVKSPSAKSNGPSASETAPKGFKDTADITFRVEASGGTFVQAPDGSIEGMLTGVAPKGSWSVRDSHREGNVDSDGLLKLVGQDADPAFIQVKDAASDRDLVSLELESVGYDEATSTWKYTASPLPAEINTAGNEAIPNFNTDADPAIAPAFGAAALVVDNGTTDTDSHGAPASNAVVGGTVRLGLGSGVNVKFAIANNGTAFNCVDTSGAPDVKSEKFGETHSFQIDTFTFSHGCGAKASWIVWDVTVQGDSSGSGQVFFGQDNAGGQYYAQCRNWAKLLCEKSGAIDQRTTTISIAPTLCRQYRPAQPPGYDITYWSVDRGATCSTTNSWSTYIQDPHWADVSNAGYVDCTIDNRSRDTVPVGGSKPVLGANLYRIVPNDGTNVRCIMVYKSG